MARTDIPLDVQHLLESIGTYTVVSASQGGKQLTLKWQSGEPINVQTGQRVTVSKRL